MRFFARSAPAVQEYLQNSALSSPAPSGEQTEQIRLGKAKAEARKMRMNIEEEDSVVVRQIEADVALQVIFHLVSSNFHFFCENLPDVGIGSAGSHS